MSHLFWAAPPMARTIAATVFTFSLLVWTNVIPVEYVLFHVDDLIKMPPEIWRIFTSFLLTGPGIGMLFDTFFLYTYAAKLEIASPRFSQRAEFFTYLLFVCTVILLLNTLLHFLLEGGTHFIHPLWLSLVTTSTWDDRGRRITFIFLEIPIQYLPYAFLFCSLLLSGIPSTLIFGTGFAASHSYDYLSGTWGSEWGNERNFLRTPQWVSRVFGVQMVTVRPYGTSVQSVQGSGADVAAVWGVSWAKRGPGRRLGGEADGPEVAETHRPSGLVMAGMVLGGFVAVFILLMLLYLRHSDPEGWWTTVLSALGIGAVEDGKESSI